MGGFSFDFKDITRLPIDLGKIAARVTQNETVAVKLAGNAYKNDVQAIAPYKTGTYRRSIHVEMSTEGEAPVALIGTNAPQALRLEYGFVGPDRLGRVYNQKPRPHWRPAWDNNLARYQRIILDALDGGRT